MKSCCTAFLLVSCVALAQTPQAKSTSDITADTVVAVLNGVPMTAAQFTELMAAMPAADRTKAMSDPDKYFGQYAHFRKILEIADKEHFAEQSPMKERLVELRKQWIVNARVSKVGDDFKLSPEEQHAWYEAHKDEYKVAKVKLIAIGFTPKASKDANGRTEEEARGMANGLVQRARLGADFSELAKKYSEDQTTRDAGGDLPIAVKATSQEVPEALRKVILQLKEGQVSDAVRADTAFYIFKATSVDPLPYEQVKDDIYARLKNAAVQKFLEDTRKQSSFKIENEEYFKTQKTTAK